MLLTRVRATAMASVLLASLAACGSGSTPTGVTTTTGPATAGPATGTATAAATTNPATIAPTTAIATSVASRGGVISVDLTLSGTAGLALKGTAGECHIGHRADGTGAFEYFANPGDFPGIGDGLFMTETAFGGKPILGIKLLLSEGPWFGNITSGYQYSADHKTLTIDTDMPETPGKPEHMKGTVVCA